MLGFDDLRSLNDLLKCDEQSSNDILDQINENKTFNNINPGHIGPKNIPTFQKSFEKIKNPHDIWDEEEINSNDKYTDVFDPRCEPQYTIHFKQTIDTSDIYLHLSNKTPSSASCEFMVIKVELPKTKYSQITLDVKEAYLDLRTPIYKLGLHLPNPVDPESGSAKWISEKFLLEITLNNKRELDFMNY